jgi:hypothetical protein
VLVVFYCFNLELFYSIFYNVDVNLSIKEKAIDLRSQGYSYSYISKKLSVGKGTLSYWLTSVPYTPNDHTLQTIGIARAKSGQYKNMQKQETLLQAHKIAKVDVGVISNRDLFMLGLGLYIGEGTKTNDQIRIVNSDPLVIKIMVKWFKKCCGLRDANFIARIHAYPDTNKDEAIIYWSKQLGVTDLKYQKTQIDRRENKTKNNRKKLPFGTLHLTIRSNGNKEFGVFLARKITAWMSLVLNK